VSRSSELLKAAAGALEEGRSPLDVSFLSEHGVSLDECFDLADWLAIGARLSAWAIQNPRLARSAASGAHSAMTMDTITRVLRKLNGEG